MPTAVPCRVFVLTTLLILAEVVHADTTPRALEVLQKNCFECHGPRGRAADTFSLADPAALARVAPPGKPAGSELLDLVAGGIMPPTGKPRLSAADQAILRDWVQAGAPNVLGHEYVWAVIAADAARAAPGDLPYYRYLSLHHRLAAGDSPSELGALRKNLNALLAHLSGKGGELTRSLGPPDTVLRIDLRQLGWNEPGLTVTQRKAGEGGKTGFVEVNDVPFNWFDLVLLEYPYGIVPGNRDGFTAVAKQFLLKSKQIRPIPAVAADWFLARASSGWLQDALLRGSDGGPSLSPRLADTYKAALDVNTALGELGGLAPAVDLRREAGRLSLGEGRTYAREAWERAFPELVRKLNLGTPITPYDSLFLEDQSRGPELTTLAFLRTTGGKPQSSFKVGDEFMPRVENKGAESLHVEVFSTQADGKRYFLSSTITQLEAGKDWTFKPAGDKPLAFNADDVPAMLMVVFASRQPLPALMRVVPREGKVPLPARYFHRLYELEADGRGLRPESDPANLARQVLKIKVEP